MITQKTNYHSFFTGATFFLLSLFSGMSAKADPVDMLRTPPEITNAVDPNVVLTFDESGSMNEAYVPGTLGDGGYNVQTMTLLADGMVFNPVTNAQECWWKDKPWVYSSAVNGLYYDENITYTPPIKYDGTSMPSVSFTAAPVDGVSTGYGITAIADGPDGTATYDLSKKYFVHWNGSLSGTVNTPSYIRPYGWANKSKTTNCTMSGVGYINFSLPLSSSIIQPINRTTATTVTEFHAFYYRFTGNPAVLSQLYDTTKYVPVDVVTDTSGTTPAETAGGGRKQNFANWFSYYRNRNLMSRTALSAAFDKVPKNVRVQWQHLDVNSSHALKTPYSGFPVRALSDATQRQTLFDFIFKTSATTGTPTRSAMVRVGQFFGTANVGNVENNPYYDKALNKELTCRQNYHLLVTDGGWKDDSGFTAPWGAGNYQKKDLTLPDGIKYSPADSNVAIYAGGTTTGTRPGFSDLALYYWAQNLRPDFKDAANKPIMNVVPYISDKKTGVIAGANPQDEIYWNPANDPATWPHLVQFVVAFGAETELAFPEDLLALRLGKLPAVPVPGASGKFAWTDWNATNASSPYCESNSGCDSSRKVDDTWHGVVNSRGKLFTAKSPKDVADSIVSALSNVLARTGSSSSTSVSATVLTGSTLGYRASYDPTDWSGSVAAYQVGIDGSLGEAKWDAGCILTGGACAAINKTLGAGEPAPDSRIIVASTTPSGAGVGFRFSNLSAAQQTALNTNPATGVADGNGDLRVKYIRGDRTQEQSAATPAFRARNSVLGAVVNSSAVYVSYPSSGFRDAFPASSPEAKAIKGDPANSYESFAYKYRARPATLYVGANDGMLHAFDATSGLERWAYVPYAVSKNLNKLTNVNFKYQPFVDSTPVISDVFINNQWRTLLVGSLRFGGKGVYALDITDPTNVTEAGAGNLVKWEFSKELKAAANIGYTFGRPNIVRLHNDKWVVLVPSGNFPDEFSSSDPYDVSDSAQANKTSSLFILDAETGALIRELQTPAGITSYGLNTTSTGDYGPDQIADFAVAGDLVGNLWRFDLADVDPNKWVVDQLFAPATPATSSKPGQSGQSITVQPIMFADPVSQKLTVVFGTGKYIGTNDRATLTSDVIQSVYGIRENGPGRKAITTANLVVQKIQTVSGSNSLRALTQNAVPANKDGWMFNFLTKDEINVTTLTPLYDTGRAILTTLIRKDADPCDPKPIGAIMVIDATTGGAPSGLPPLSGTAPANTQIVGSTVIAPPLGDPVTAATTPGGGKIVLPGMVINDGNAKPTTFSATDSYWRRRAWRELFQPQG